jgi:hypothetical protein
VLPKVSFDGYADMRPALDPGYVRDGVVDAGLVALRKEISWKNTVVDEGPIAGTRRVQLRDRVWKVGMTTGKTSGIVVDIAFGDGQIKVISDQEGLDFAQEGDSGSLVFVRDTNPQGGERIMAVGMLNSIARHTNITPIDTVFERLNVEFAPAEGEGRYTEWYPPSNAWESLGGTTPDAIGAASWGGNRLDVFRRGYDNKIYHKWWDGSAWQPSQTDWSEIGGQTLGPVTAVSWGVKRLDLFVRGVADNCVYHKWWDGSAWQPSPNWELLHGITTSDAICAASWFNRLDVFVRGPNNEIYHEYWIPAAWYPSPTEWESLGGQALGPVTAVSWGENRLDLFVRGADNSVNHRW